MAEVVAPSYQGTIGFGISMTIWYKLHFGHFGVGVLLHKSTGGKGCGAISDQPYHKIGSFIVPWFRTSH
jgi:hypothetical protein